MNVDISKLKITYNIFEYYTLHIINNNLLGLENKLKSSTRKFLAKFIK